LPVIIDPGAGISIVDKALVPVSSMKPPKNLYTLTAATGDVLKVIGELEIDLKFGKQQIQLPILVADWLPMKVMIMGNDVLGPNDPTLRYKPKELELSGGGMVEWE
jgi:hypothetical protein